VLATIKSSDDCMLSEMLDVANLRASEVALWRLEGGRAKLWADGRLVVDVDGLVLAAGGAAGTNPIPNGQAIVTCAGAVAAMSSVVPFSVPDGDAHISETVSLPSGCLEGVPRPGRASAADRGPPAHARTCRAAAAR